MPNGDMEVIDDGVIAIRPAVQSRLLAQQEKFKKHLAALVKSLSGDTAPKDFNHLAVLLFDEAEKARHENTRGILG